MRDLPRWKKEFSKPWILTTTIIPSKWGFVSEELFFPMMPMRRWLYTVKPRSNYEIHFIFCFFLSFHFNRSCWLHHHQRAELRQSKHHRKDVFESRPHACRGDRRQKYAMDDLSRRS